MSEAPPKLFIHACTVFETMQKAAKYAPARPGDTHNSRVYEGFLTKLFQELHLPAPAYTTVLRVLKKMGCIKQLSRGGGSAPSRWELLKEPEYGDFEACTTQPGNGSRLSVVEKTLQVALDRIDDLEDRLERTGTDN